MATAILHVANAAPVANDIAFTVSHDRTLTVSASGVLANSSDADGDAITAQLVSGVAHGTVALAVNGSFNYVPAAGYVGDDSFSFQASDGLTTSAVATCTIHVTNAAPIVFADSFQVTHDRTLTVPAAGGVLSVDRDPDGDAMTAAVVAGPAHGTLTLAADGSFVYQPAAGFVGSDQFTYTAGDGLAVSGLVTVTIAVQNHAPAATDDVYEMLHDTTLTVPAAQGLLANDIDTDGDTLTPILYGTVTTGSLTLNADGSFSYTPPAGFYGTVQFQYQDSDGAALSNLAKATITVAAPAPLAQDDSFTVLHDHALSETAADGVLANDASLDGSALTAVLDSGPADGAVTLAADGSFTYTPNAGFVGADSFTYHDTTPFAASASATVTIDVTDQAPSVADMSFSTLHGQTLIVNAAAGVLAGALDGDGNPLTAVLDTNVSDGTLTLASDGSFTYVPAAGFYGSDSFTFTAFDGAESSGDGTVAINVSENAPVADDASFTLNHDHTLTVSAAAGLLADASDSDGDGDALTAQLVAPANNGTVTVNSDGSFSYTPDAHFVGGDTFSYLVSDGLLDSGVATVTLTVVNTAPDSTDDTYNVVHDHTLTVNAAAGVLANDTDAQGDALSAGLVDGAADGALTFNPDGSFSYVPLAGFVGTDGFSYMASDGIDPGAVTQVTINVTNQAPTAGNVSYSLDQGQTLSVQSGNLLSAASDADGDPLTVEIVTGAANGALSVSPDGDFTYTPDASFSGADSFSFLVSDGIAQSAAATATITVHHLNELPTLTPPSLTVYAGQTLSGNLLDGVSVPNGDTLTAAAVTQPADGTLALNADGTFSYTPATGFVGSDSFTFDVQNGTAATSPITVSIDVANTPPVASAASYVTYLTTPLAVSSADGLLTHATDADGDSLTASLVSGPGDGTVTVNADGSFTYTANSGFTGTDSFSYLASDGLAPSAPATVSVTVTANTVIGNAETFSVVHDRGLNVPAVAGVLRNDYAVDGGAITATLVSATTHGTLTLNADGSLSYSPAAGYVGDDQFSYQALEGGAASAVVTDTIHVTNNAPVSAADSYSVLHDRPLVVAANTGVLANDYDDDRDTLVATLATGPAHGTLSLNSDGSFTYTPTAGFVGSDSFTYTAGDGVSDGGPTAVSISVTDTAPTGQGATYNVHHGQTLAVAAPGVRAFDYDADGDATSLVLVSGPTHGTLTLNQDGSFTYVPTPLAGGRDFVGADSFSYLLNDGALDSSPITITINVADDAPQANSDFYTVHVGAAVSGNVLANDVDADGDTLKAVPVSLPAGVTLDAAGNLSAPGTLAPGTYTATYMADDNGLYSNVAVVTINVADSAPVAAPDLFSTPHDQALSGANVLTNDWDPDGDALTAVLVTPPAHAGAGFSLSSTGDVSYTPAAGFVGADSFTYRASDGHLSSAVVTVTINVTDDAPYAAAGFATTTEGTPVSGNVLTNAVLPDPANTTVSLASPPADGAVTLNADGSYTYTPKSGFSGVDSFIYQLSDGAGTSTATVNVAVQSNEVMTTDSNYSMDLANGSLTVAAPGVLAGDTTDSSSLTARLDTGTTNGTLTLNQDGSFTYTPNANFVGSDSFTYDAVMADGQSQTATVTISVTKQPPVAADSSGAAAAGTTTTSVASILANSSDNGGTIDPNTFNIVAQPHHGSVSVQPGAGGGSVVYTPDVGFSGQDSYYYTVSDSGQTSNAAKVTLTVAPPDSIAIGNVAATGPQDTPLVIDVLANVTVNGQPAAGLSGVTIGDTNNGTFGRVTVSGGQLTYTPNPGWIGMDSFTFTVTDAAGTSVQGTAYVRITAAGSTLSASDETVSVPENSSLSFSLPQLYAYVEVSSPTAHGTLANDENGEFVYTPDRNFAGGDSFKYIAYDNDWNSVTGTVTINVTTGTGWPESIPPTQPVFSGTPTYGDPGSPDPDPLIVQPGSTYTSVVNGVIVENGCSVPIIVTFNGALHETDIAPQFPADSYDVSVSGVHGYENAKWTAPFGTYFTFSADGSLDQDFLSPGTDFNLVAGNTIGAVTGNDVFATAGFGIGAVNAAGNASVGTGGIVPGVTAEGNIGYVMGYRIAGAIRAGEAIGAVTAVENIVGGIDAGSGIGGVSAYDITGNITTKTGDIGFGPEENWGQPTFWFGEPVFGGGLGVTAANALATQISAPQGSINYVQADTITSTTIVAENDVDMVVAEVSLANSNIIANRGSIDSVSVGRGGILNTSIYAGANIGGGGGAPAGDPVDFNLFGYLGIADGVGTGGTLSGGSIEAGGANSPLPSGEGQGEGGSGSGGSSTTGNIATVSALVISDETIDAAGDIQVVGAGTSISATIKAGGGIGSVSTSLLGNWGYVGGLAQDISGSITAGGDINSIRAGRDLAATVQCANLYSVRADRDLSGEVNASGKITYVTVGRSASAPVSGNSVFAVAVGYDLATGANITSNGGINEVTVGHTLAGNITAKGGGITSILVMGPNLPINARSQASMQGATISVSGDIGTLGVMAGPGSGGDITGATITAANIGTLAASGNLDATITASGGIGTVAAGTYLVPYWTLRDMNGGDLTGSVTAGTSIDNVIALARIIHEVIAGLAKSRVAVKG